MLSSKSLCWLLVALIAFGRCLIAGEPTPAYAALSADLVAVPQNLLGLSHTLEVQRELKLTSSELAQWEDALREVDKIWWPARILPADQQRETVADLEAKLVVELESIQGRPAVNRLRQIELQSQGARALVRPELVKFLRLDASQKRKLVELFKATDAFGKDIAAHDEKTPSKSAAAKRMEPTKALAILRPAQAGLLKQCLGEALNITTVERIYPFAPELIDSHFWTTDAPVSLSSMRGKVVVVHFYAFQCHNCVANFGHYERWSKTLKSKGVEVVGIQTPETLSEHDPKMVINAAKKAGFTFPVLIDVESKNWDAWGNTMWPTVYVIDKQGYIRYWWQGELNWQGASTDKKVEALIDQLLNE